jgi:transcriptional regulator with XRE-family HTH domain
MAFAETLRRIRIEQFLSQAELGRRAGIHPLTVTRLESGASAPTTRTLRALAAALDVLPRVLAAPEEVAELRRVLALATHPAGGSEEALNNWADDGGSAETLDEPLSDPPNPTDSTARPREA